MTRLKTIESLGPWFHNLHLPDGTETCPDHWLGDFPGFLWRQIEPHLPERMDGWQVLDVGCNAGFYSLQLARRGARVTGIDIDDRYLRQARWAAEEFGLSDRIELRKQPVYALAGEETRYDLVVFMGVLYHLRYPLLGLDTLSRLTGRMMVFQTLTAPVAEGPALEVAHLDWSQRQRLGEPGWPRMSFIEHWLADDPTNWWAPDPACVEAMLRSSGLRVTERVGPEVWLCAPDETPSSHWRWNAAEWAAATGRQS